MKINFLQMKRVTSTALFVLLMMAGMRKVMAQTPYRQYAEDGILLNFHEIDNADFRLFLLYNLNQDDRFVLIEDDISGQFSVISNNEENNLGFYDAFESFYQNAYTDFNLLSKMDILSVIPNWKNSVPPAYFVSIMMDIAMRNSRPINNHCVDSEPFYTSDVMQFTAASTSQTADQLEGTTIQDGCIGSSYNPSWFHMVISNPGQIIIHMQGCDPNNTSVNRDIDFCVWGPFTDPVTPCVAQLTTDKIMDCSYSASYSEDMYLGYPANEHYHSTNHGTVNYHMPESGEYYILMITNYSQQPCVISFSQTGGTGSSGCYGQKNITANVNSVEGGSVTGAGEYECGSSCTLTATANEGYVFMDWTDENGVVVSTDTEYTFTVYTNKNYTANFVEEDNVCYLTFNLNDSDGNGWSGNYLVLNFEDGSSQKLTIPHDSSLSSYSLPIVDGSHISLSWVSGFNPNQCSFMVTYSNGNVICYGTNLDNSFNYGFDVDCVGMPGNSMSFEVAAESNPLEGGFVNGAGQYDFNETCTLTAMANGGYEFVNWTENGVIVSTNPTYSFFVAQNRNLVANFNQYVNHWTAESYVNDMFMIGVVQIDGIEQTSPTLELGAFCNDECRGTEFPVYEDGRWWYYMNIGGNSGDDITFRLYDHALQQELNLHCFNEIPFEYYGLIGIDNPYEVLFASLFTISVEVNPEDAGTVTGAGTYINGTEVTLTATANSSTFINWTIGDEQVSTDTVYSFVVTEDLTLVANFLPRYEVTVLVNPTEGGSISGAGIYDSGTECTLIATPNAGYAFGNWSIDGEIVSTEPSYTFTVTASVNLTANFGILYPVSATVNPENAGIIIGEGIYVSGTSATLTANPNEGYAFNNWTLDGEIVSTELSYTFMVTGPMSFTANFDVLHSVSATVNLENAGTIIGTGIYVLGTNATLIASPNEGYAFNNWTLDGEIVSTEPSYTFMVTESVNLTANFDVIRTQQLVEGWNWWSSNLEITLDQLKSALVEALPGTIITIKSRTQNTAYNPSTSRWRGTLTSLDMAQMYMIEVSTDCEITLTGIPVNPTEHPITIHNGSNWIAFPLRESMPINDALAGFPAVSGDIIKSRSKNAIYLRGQWRGAVTTLEPGQGYIFISNAQEDRTLIFGTNNSK